MPKLKLGALIITMLLIASCGSGAKNSPSNMNNQAHPAAALVDRWRQVSPADEDVTMAFMPDGKLVYSIHVDDKTQIINMVYEVSGDQIITDQPSHPRRMIARDISCTKSGHSCLNQGPVDCRPEGPDFNSHARKGVVKSSSHLNA